MARVTRRKRGRLRRFRPHSAACRGPPRIKMCTRNERRSQREMVKLRSHRAGCADTFPACVPLLPRPVASAMMPPWMTPTRRNQRADRRQNTCMWRPHAHNAGSGNKGLYSVRAVENKPAQHPRTYAGRGWQMPAIAPKLSKSRRPARGRRVSARRVRRRTSSAARAASHRCTTSL